MGRKPPDAKLLDEIVNSISLGLSDKTAYEAAGVSHGAFYQWIQKGTDDPHATPPRKAREPYKNFVERLSRARAEFIRNHVATVTAASMGSVIEHYGPDGRLTHIERKNDGDWRAAKWLLSVRQPDQFSERYVVENRNAPVPVEDPHRDLDDMSPEELAAEEARLRARSVEGADGA